MVIAEKAFWFRALDCPRPPAAARARRVAAVILVGAVTALPETASPEGNGYRFPDRLTRSMTNA